MGGGRGVVLGGGDAAGGDDVIVGAPGGVDGGDDLIGVVPYDADFAEPDPHLGELRRDIGEIGVAGAPRKDFVADDDEGGGNWIRHGLAVRIPARTAAAPPSRTSGHRMEPDLSPPIAPAGSGAADPIRTYDDLTVRMRRLLAPLERFRSAGKAKIDLPGPAAHYSPHLSGLEGFARPLWALAAAAKGGVAGIDREPWLEGLAAGSDPRHPEFWGRTKGPNQRTVEGAAIAFAIAMSPQIFFDPLPSSAKANLVHWLDTCRKAEVLNNNWQFFPVLIELGLRRAGAPAQKEAMARHLAAVDARYAGSGWYRDGLDRFDHYNGFAFHFYGLVCALLMVDDDPARAAEFRTRAAQFAEAYQYWFGADGGAVPMGRSLTYRFAQAAFWGMLAAADLEALPWPRIKGLFLRNLDWWFARPILDSSGVLTVGYAYPTLFASDEYNSPASPYWAMKAMIALAASPMHPFWRTQAEDASDLPDGVRAEPVAGLVSSRSGGHAVILSGGQKLGDLRQAAAKYGKLAYSSVFGFSTQSDCRTLQQMAPDSALVLWRKDRGLKTREAPEAVETGADWVYSRWRPWADTTVETWLRVCGPYHLRAHSVDCPDSFESIEAGFAIPIPEHVDLLRPEDGEFAAGVARIASQRNESAVVDLERQRMGRLVTPLPNTNVHHPRTVVPVLRGSHGAGTVRLTPRVWAHCGIGPATATMDLNADRAALEEIMRRGSG